MIHDEIDSLVFLVIITKRKQKDAIVSAVLEEGAQLTSVIYGREGIRTSSVMDALGMVPDNGRALINCITRKDTADSILDMLIEKFHFDKPHTSIAFTIPIEQLSF